MLGSRSLRRLRPDIAVVKAADTREPYNPGLVADIDFRMIRSGTGADGLGTAPQA